MEQIIQKILSKSGVILLISFFLVILGLFYVFQIQEELLPNISFPVVSISVSYPGADANTVLQNVTKPIETAINQTPGISSTNSTTFAGVSAIEAQFDINTDINTAVDKINSELNSLSLPQGAQKPIVSKFSFSDIPVIEYTVSGENTSQNQKFVDETLVPSLTTVSGVGKVSTYGEQTEKYVVTPDTSKLSKYGISYLTLLTTLKNDNISVPIGQANTNRGNIPIILNNNFQNISELENLTIPTLNSFTNNSANKLQSNSNQTAFSPIKLSDIATISLSNIYSSYIVRSNNSNAILVEVLKTEDANTVNVASNVRDEIKKLNSCVPSGTNLSLLYDSSVDIQNSINGIIREGGLGAILTVLIILLFLRSINTTLISFISIPLSLLASLVVMSIFGISLNIMSLSGLTVAIGRIVDDSIVVIENIFRHLSQGDEKNLKTIAVSVSEVSNAIITSTATTVAVFLPIGFAGGIVSKFFSPFAITAATALVCSLLVAIVIIPILSKYFLINRNVKFTNKPFFLIKYYQSFLIKTLNHKRISLFIIALLFFGSLLFIVFKLIPFGFLPNSSSPNVTVSLSLPAGSSIDQTQSAAKQMEQYVLKSSKVDKYATLIGSSGNGGFTGITETNQALIDIIYKENTNVDPIVTSLRGDAKNIPNATINISSQSLNGSNNTVSIDISGSNYNDIKDTATNVTDILKNTSGVVNVTNNLTSTQEEYQIIVDTQKASNYGLDPQALSTLLQGLLNDPTIGNVTQNNNSIAIQVSSPYKANTGSIQSLGTLLIPTQYGIIPLSTIAEIQDIQTNSIITERNRQLNANISGTVTSNDYSGTLAKVQKSVSKIKIPSDVTIDYTGTNQQQNEAFSSLGIAMLTSIFIVFVIMLIAFGSLRTPLSILFSLPVALIGVLTALFITQKALDLPALIGILMLIGIVVTNAVVLMDRVHKIEIRDNLPLREAIVTGATQRLRPILMTALATIFALVPLALGFSEGAIISASLAIVVIGGLFSSTILTLIVVPCIYEGLRHFRNKDHI